MAERHKREAKLNRGRKAKNKGREVLPNTKKSTSTEVINQEHKEIIKWFQTVKFRRTLQELNQLYESAIRAERERYNILLTDHEKTYESQIYKYKQELMKNEGTTEQTEMDNTENEVPPETRNEVRR